MKRFVPGRYSLYYFASVSMYAFVLGFFPLHCKDIGFSATEISILSALATAANMIGPPLMLHAAHAWIAPRKIIVVSMILAVLCFLPLLGITTFLLTAVLWLIAGSLSRGSAALIDAQAIRDSVAGIISFERVRLWGSVGFIVLTYCFGALVDIWGLAVIMPMGLAIVIATCFSAFPVSAMLPNKRQKETAKVQHSIFSPKMRPVFFRLVLLLVTVALVSASHSVLYVYLSLYLDALGWSATMISSTWTLGVIAEITFFLCCKRLEQKFTLKTVLKISISAAVLRWLILFYSSEISFILASQLLHGLSFGGCYIASMKLIHKILPDHLKDRGQGLLALFGTGTGSVLGRIFVGVAASSLPSYYYTNQLFALSAVLALVALLVSYFIDETPANEGQHRNSEFPTPVRVAS